MCSRFGALVRVARGLVVGLCLIVGVLDATPSQARVYLSVKEALKLAFPGCSIEHPTIYLTEDQMNRARALAEVPVEDAIVRPYRATCEGRPGGVAYLDVHRVRTLPETLMIVVSPEGEVERVEVLSFREPPEYKPRAAWYELFTGHRLDDRLRLKRDLPIVAGATLTSHATEAAVRRVLAIDRVLRAVPEGARKDGDR